MEIARTIPPRHQDTLRWLDRFASARDLPRMRDTLAGELHNHLCRFYDTLATFEPGTSTSVRPAARPQSESLSSEQRQYERAALMDRVGETLYVLRAFSNSPSLSDVWMRGQIRRFLDAFARLQP